MTPENLEDHPPTTNEHAIPDGLASLPAARPARRSTVTRSRMGGLWVAAVTFALVLLLLMIFVLQNGQSVQVSFLGAHGSLPMGVALLLAAIFGVLLVALPGSARIMQLRIRGRRRQPAVVETRDKQLDSSEAPPSVPSVSAPRRTET